MTRSLAVAIPVKLAAAATAALFAALLAASPGAHSQTQPPAQPMLTGTATWDGSAALADSATFEATVLDVTPTGRAPELIGRTQVRPIQYRPLRFAVPYDPALMKPGHSYSIEARIVDRGAQMYATTAPVPLRADGAPAPVALSLPASSGVAAAPPAAGYPTATRSVTGTPWALGSANTGAGGVASSPLPPPPAPPSLLGSGTDTPQPPLIVTRRPAGTMPAATSSAGTTTGALLPLPAQYAGTLPCADCTGIRYELDLQPGGPYRLSQEYLGKPGEPVFHTVGQWRYDAATRVLTLDDDPSRPVAFEVTPTGNLRLLDVAGRPIVSNLNYELRPTGATAPLPVRTTTVPAPLPAPAYPQPPLASAPPAYGSGATGAPMALSRPGSEPARRLRGLYRGSTSGASFLECGDSRAVAISPNGQDALLSSAYARVQPQPGQPVLAEVDGRIGFGPTPGGGLGRVLTVDRFVAVHPGASCEPAGQPTAMAPPAATGAATGATTGIDAGPPLRETTWWLLAVGPQTVATAVDRRQPFLQLNADLPVFNGNSGCNNVGGEYALADHSLSFNLGPSTRMACPGTDELERAFRDGLARTSTWGVTGDHLTLYGADGTPLLRFSSRAPA